VQVTSTVDEQITRLHEGAAQASQALGDQVATVERVSLKLDEQTRQLESRSLQAGQVRQTLDDAVNSAATQGLSMKQLAGQLENRASNLTLQIDEVDARSDRLAALHAKLSESCSPEAAQALDNKCARLERLVDQASVQLVQLKEESDRVAEDQARKLEALTTNLGRAAQRSEHLEGVINQADGLHLAVARQTRVARQAKCDLEKLMRRLARERALADASLEGLRQVQCKGSEAGLGAGFAPLSETLGDAGQNRLPPARGPERFMDVLDTIRRAMETPEQPLGIRQPDRCIPCHREPAVCRTSEKDAS